MVENAPQAESRQTLPSWIKDEGTQPIRFFQPWMSLFTGICVLAFLTQRFFQLPSHLVFWTLVPIGLAAVFISLYQVVWITPTGVAWRTLRDRGWVHWSEITFVKEIIGSRFIPAFAQQESVLHLPIEKVSLQRVRQILSSRPRLDSLALPASAEVPDLMSSTASTLLAFGCFLFLLGLDPSGIPFGMTALRFALIVFSVLMAGTGLLAFLSGAQCRWRRTVEITEEGLITGLGSSRKTLKFSDIRRAEMITSANGPCQLTMESVADVFVLPYVTPNFDQWKVAIEEKLPEGVVIKDG